MQTVVSVPASIEPDPRRYSRIYPPVAGRIIRLHVQLGDQVNKGQILATLQAPEFTQARSEYEKARGALEIARRTLERQRDLLARKIAAGRDVEQAQAEHAAAKSQFESVAEKMKSYGVNPERSLDTQLQLTAPLAGRVVDLAAAPGEFRNDSSQPLMIIADLSIVWLTANVAEKDLRFIRKGAQARAVLAAYPEQFFEGSVAAVGDLLDPDTRVTKVRVAVANGEGRLKPGMFATVDILDVPRMVITVPNDAILQLGDSTVVYQQTQPWRLEPKEVTLGAQLGERTIVLAGLDRAATIVAREAVLLQQ